VFADTDEALAYFRQKGYLAESGPG
jgi:hypothetical protein